MAIPQPQIFLIPRLIEWAEQAIRARACLERSSSHDEAILMREASEANAIILGGRGIITRSVIEAAPKLRVIGRIGVGVDNIDLAAAKDRGVVVVNTPQANWRSVAEFTVGLMLAVTRRIVGADDAVRAERAWGDPHRFTGTELFGKTLGLIGVGRIGSAVGAICGAGFGMRIRYYDYLDRPWRGLGGVEAVPVGIDDLLATADLVSLHVPLCTATHHLLDRRRLSLMSESSVLINTARGSLVDEAALADALTSGRMAGAGLDVMEVEPLRESPLQALPNVVLTSHIASHTHEAFRSMSEVIYDVFAVLDGQAPRWRVV